MMVMMIAQVHYAHAWSPYVDGHILHLIKQRAGHLQKRSGTTGVGAFSPGPRNSAPFLEKSRK
eukprot:11025380-Karenia_brevis.AAC.1